MNAALPSAATAVPSFHDLRRFAAEAEVDAVLQADPETGDADPFLDSRRLLDLPESPVSVGVILLPAGSGAVPALAADEFVIVSSGQLVLEAAGARQVLEAGNSAVIRRGTGFVWSAAEPTRVIFMRYAHASAGDAAIVPIDEQAPLQPSGAPLAELLLTPTPNCRNFTDYRSDDGEFVCGTWDSTPYTRSAMAYRHYELMYLLQGEVTFVDCSGRSGTFGEGDIFLVQQHANCSWESLVDVKKVYAIWRPA